MASTGTRINDKTSVCKELCSVETIERGVISFMAPLDVVSYIVVASKRPVRCTSQLEQDVG